VPCRSFLFAGLLLAAGCQQQASVNIVPEPVSIIHKCNGHFVWTKNTALVLHNVDSLTGEYIQEYFEKYLGMTPAVILAEATDEAPEGAVVFGINPREDAVLGREGYRLAICSNNMEASANTSAGLVYALQTIYQLAPADVAVNHLPEITFPLLVIEDYPRFEWRGSHRDVARHFFDVAHIKKHLDLMALYKMNKFHFHLTDDHGWRLQIDKYPELTDIGAWRPDRTGISWRDGEQLKKGEPATYGGYYTKEEIRDIIQYAAVRNIEVMPEIEIPGHSSAILVAYPQLACDNYPYFIPVGPYWPPKAILCGGSDQVMPFLFEVLDEVADLFPCEYIHVGGDEAVKDNWKTCPKCQQRIKDLQLKDEEALQGWMMREIEQHLATRGKKIVGWDEILEGGVSPSATIMYWRGWEGDSLLVEAARSGHPIIMCPNSHAYFDYYQIENDPAQESICCYLPLEQAYSFDPVPASLTEAEATAIKGGQCNLWAEFLYGPKEAEYMLIPRILAMSESVWSPKGHKNWQRFVTNLPAQKERLGHMGYHYCDKIGRK
jgi:hexosaminidase